MVICLRPGTHQWVFLHPMHCAMALSCCVMSFCEQCPSMTAGEVPSWCCLHGLCKTMSCMSA
jgi:hypothetical protein